MMDDALFDEALNREEEWGEEGQVPDFPDQYVDPLTELVQLGHLEKEWEEFGHSFRIRTLRIGEELRALKLTREFDGVQMAEGRAYATAIVSAAVEEVDGMPLVVKISPSQDLAQVKYRKVMRWFWPVIEMVYRQYTTLEREQAEILQALQQSLENADDSTETTDTSLE